MTLKTGLLTLLILTFTAGLGRADDSEILKIDAKEWKYLDDGKDPPKDWHSQKFDDSKWKSGQAPLGYGDGDIKQKVSFGDDENNKRICYLFRRTIEVKKPKAFLKVMGNFYCDDGCAIYLNGKEVHRHNLPEGKLKKDTVSLITAAGDVERHQFTFLIDADKFSEGKNTLAVRLHQRGAESSDLAFNLSLTGLDDEAAVKEAKETQEFEKQQIKAALEGNLGF